MKTIEASSFRDRAGFVYFEAGQPYRAIGERFASNWQLFSQSGLMSELHEAGLLIPHEDMAPSHAPETEAFAVIKPERVPFISYPYEWCFSQLKAAALTTLELQRRALDRGMWLRDASAYNIQFLRGSPILIDSLSFEKYEEGRPWPAYRQFCRHFLAPLAMMARVHPEANLLLRPHLDGIPLDLASAALPFRTRFHAGLAVHLHLHAKAERHSGSSGAKSAKVSEVGLRGLIDSLRRTIEGLKWQPRGTVWADYYSDTNYSPPAMSAKKSIVENFLRLAGPRVVWDLGANTGEFSALAATMAERVVAWDVDPAAVERHFRSLDEGSRVLPLVQDLTNPSPSLGWAHEERASLASRADADVVMVLALVHHLAIGNNVPLGRIAEFLARLGEWLIIEFVPKEDSQVQRLLASREDIFDDYSLSGFEASFGQFYNFQVKKEVEESKRTLYLLKRKGAD